MRVQLDQSALDRLARSGGGPVAEHVAALGARVADGARSRVGRDSGALAASIEVVPVTRAGEVGVAVGSRLDYALVHHEGRREVVAAPGHTLVFTGRDGELVYRRRVRGVPANRYLLDALAAIL